MKRKKNKIIILLRLLVIALLLAASFGVEHVTFKDQKMISLLLDVSDSVDLQLGESYLKQARELIKDLDVEVELYCFAKDHKKISFYNEALTYSEIKSICSQVDASNTNLEKALNIILKNGALLLSDGLENGGSAQRQAKSFLSPIYPIIPQNFIHETKFGVLNLNLPLFSESGKSIKIAATVSNTTTSINKGELKIFQGDKELDSRMVEIKAGEEMVIEVDSDSSAIGVQEVKALFKPEGSLPSSTIIKYLSSGEREKVLLVSGAEREHRPVAALLKLLAIPFEEIVAEQNTKSLPSLSKFRGVIFNNVALPQLGQGSDRQINRYLKEEGGGFLMLGGERSFGLGAYRGSDIDSILPVEMVPPQALQKRLNIAIELVIDKSGSMAQGQKLDYAIQAAREVLNNLKDDDYYGVIGFDSTPWLVVELMRVADNRDSAYEKVGRLTPAKKTNLFPAIDQARRMLEGVKAGRKHMIIITDGRVPDAGPYYVEFVRQMRMSGITVSTVMLGGESDISMMQDMADEGGGSFYQTLDPANLPRIFVSDVKAQSSERTLKEEKNYSVRKLPTLKEDFNFVDYPYLRGYVDTKRREEGEVLLAVTDGEISAPLLAFRAVGKGRSVAFTSDIFGRWSNQWYGWSELENFISRLLELTINSKAEANNGVAFDLRYFLEGSILNLELSIFDESALNNISGYISSANFSEERLIFEEQVVGRYKAKLNVTSSGRYDVKLEAGGKKLPPLAINIPSQLFGEKSGQGINVALLNEIALYSKGAINPAREEVKTLIKREESKRDLSPLFFVLAALLFLTEIFSRVVWKFTEKR
jgi:FixJ family two-component response regulator